MVVDGRQVSEGQGKERQAALDGEDSREGCDGCEGADLRRPEAALTSASSVRTHHGSTRIELDRSRSRGPEEFPSPAPRRAKMRERCPTLIVRFDS